MLCQTDTPKSSVVLVEKPEVLPALPPPEETENLEVDLRNFRQREYRKKNREKLLAIERRYRAKHMPEISKAAAEYKKKHWQRYTAWRKNYEAKNRLRLREKNNAYHKAHKARRTEQKLRSREKHKQKWLEGQRAYRAKNRDRICNYLNNYLPKWRAKQRLENPQFLLKDRMRSALNRAVRKMGFIKSKRTEELIGCTMSDLRIHLQGMFSPGMEWSNPKSFVVDHIVPIVAFDLRDNEEAMVAFNWKNLRPITQAENARKSDTIPSPLPDWLPAHIAARIESRR